MKTKLFLLFTSIIYLNINAQIVVEHIISTDVDGASSIFAGDFDGDGNMDVLSAAAFGNSIDWWENDGNATNFTRHNISTDVDFPFQVYAADIDGDNDMDVFYVTADDDKLAWHENDGAGNFGPQQLITAQANTDELRFLDIADIDGDGLDDVLSASLNDNKIAWYKNLGNGDFGDINTNQRIISDIEIGAFSVHATDINDDGKMDVVAASFIGNEIIWFRNINPLNNDWERKIIDIERDGALSVSSADFDGDGTMDLVSASQRDNTIAWHKNKNGDGSVWENIIVTDTEIKPSFVYATDYDDDGDMEFLAATSTVFDRIVLYVYDGNDNFTEDPKSIITTADFPVSVHAEDVDGDGFKDILSASVNDNKIAWYDYILSVNDNLLLDFSVYPNPAKGILNIQSKTNIVQIDIYNLLGQLVLSNNEENTIDISRVSQGLYFIKVKDENGNVGSKKIVKN